MRMKQLSSEHGGPIRLIVPHLYFLKSAKWLNRIDFIDNDKPGFGKIMAIICTETRGKNRDILDNDILLNILIPLLC